MNALRIEADEAIAKVEELSADKKRLEQENLAKEQEITSLTHKNQLLEAEVEKLESNVKDAKAIADESTQAGTHNESLTRRVQLLEEEAEEADKNLRETNEKYVTFLTPKRFWFPCVRTCRRRYRSTHHSTPLRVPHNADTLPPGSARPTCGQATTSARCRLSRPSGTSGRPSTRRWPRSTPTLRRSWTTSSTRLATSNSIPGVCLLLYNNNFVITTSEPYGLAHCSQR